MRAPGSLDRVSAPWAARQEGGSTLLLRAMLFVALRLGWWAGRAMLLPVTAWFLLTGRSARAASCEYLGRVLGRPARLIDVARHFDAFSTAVLDRVFLIADRTDRYQITAEGLDLVDTVVARGRGCVLLGAHLGSFEVLRSLRHRAPAPVRPVMYRRNAGALTDLLDRLAPDLRASIIEIGDPDSMLRVKESVDRGEIVGILADRSPGSQKKVVVPFLGSPAAFPAGPFILAHSVGAPVVLFRAVRTGPRRYQVRFEPFADRLALRRASRDRDMREWVGRYAAWLEDSCRAHPYNWFNFFPFWDVPAELARDANDDPAVAGAAASAASAASGPGAARGPAGLAD